MEWRWAVVLRECFLYGLSLWALGVSVALGAGRGTIVLPPQAEIAAAEIQVLMPNYCSVSECRGALVFCPGQNGSSMPHLNNTAWQEFAQREKLVLVGMRFVSSDEDLKGGRGYFVASRGSGGLLEEGLKKAGLDRIPLLLYGFSGGAHFVMSFSAWRPNRVVAFCAYSFAWWKAPPEELHCPSLIVCGQTDGKRYGSSLAYFQAGRKQNKPWTWVTLANTAHAPNAKLDNFVRDYFACVLRDKEGETTVRVDNMTEQIVDEPGKENVSTSVLPTLDLLSKWQEIHHP